jgi:transcriptional regulator with XRE-family HTH domain
MITTGDHLRQAREAMGWSPADLARALRFNANHGASRVLELEAGKRALSGPLTVAVEALLRGFLPDGFEPPEPPSHP